MRVFSDITSDNLEWREVQLSILTCFTIFILGIGLAALMYPVALSGAPSAERVPGVIVIGLSVLCFLFAVYVWDRHRTIRRLRRQLYLSQKLVARVQTHAGVELLSALPRLEQFQDCLCMELRRAAATLSELSILVITLKLAPHVTSDERTELFSGAAKMISRELRQRESIYILASTCLGIVLPNVNMVEATRISEWMAEGLSKKPGAGSKVFHMISTINYPRHASSASKFMQVVHKLMPEDNFDRLQSEATRAD